MNSVGVGETIVSSGQITYNTYQWNSVAKQTFPGGSIMEYAYDPLMKLKTILTKDPAANNIMARSYTYSPMGNITNKDTEHGNYAYQYDKLYRLTQADNPTLADEAYTYDAIGNRLTANGTTGLWSYNANNELTGYGSTTFTYDANGNTTNKTNGTNITNFIYDVEDRMTQVKDGSGGVIANYYYDPFGRRLWKEIDGQKTYFLYADGGLIGEYDTNGQEIKTYGYEPNSIWGTNPLYQRIGTTYYWYNNNSLGTPQKIVDTNGRVVWSAVYDSFGNCQILVEEITNNLRFAGQYYDAETGLHYNWQRYYDPQTGRYLRTDPLRVSLNLYTYCFNNPFAWIDPFGLCPEDPTYCRLKCFADLMGLGFVIHGTISGGAYIIRILNAGKAIVLKILKLVTLPFEFWHYFDCIKDCYYKEQAYLNWFENEAAKARKQLERAECIYRWLEWELQYGIPNANAMWEAYLKEREEELRKAKEYFKMWETRETTEEPEKQIEEGDEDPRGTYNVIPWKGGSMGDSRTCLTCSSN